MPAPLAAAEAIITWFANRPLAVIAEELAALTPDHQLLRHAELIADAADSDHDDERSAGLQALFAGLVEPLNDGFTPSGRAVYARMFGHVVWHLVARTPTLRDALAQCGITTETELLERHHRLRTAPSSPPEQAQRIVVLSRVTIGADILLTSVALQRLHQRYPQAELVLLGDGKLHGLFAGLPKVRVRAVSYARRGPLRERLASWLVVRDAVAEEAPDLVMAPDSRLDQLGLLPVCADDRYVLWENLQPEGGPVSSLAQLLDEWMSHHFSLQDFAPVVPHLAFAPEVATAATTYAAAFGSAPIAAVKLDHGGNSAKALPRSAELEILRTFRANGWRILLDRGFGAEELANSDDLVKELGWDVIDIDDSGKGLGLHVSELAPQQLANASAIRFHGSIAGWAAALAQCGHAFSYDSVGHHLAAALGIPVTVAFTGYSDPGFPVAWQPRGGGQITVVTIPLSQKTNSNVLADLISTLPSA